MFNSPQTILAHSALQPYFSILHTYSGGEISSDLYRDQFSRRILNFSSLMFILLFFIDFWGLCDEKIHSRAQLFFLSIFFPYLHVSCPDMTIDIFSESYEVGILNK